MMGAREIAKLHGIKGNMGELERQLNGWECLGLFQKTQVQIPASTWDSSQLSITPAPADLTTSSGLSGTLYTCVHTPPNIDII